MSETRKPIRTESADAEREDFTARATAAAMVGACTQETSSAVARNVLRAMRSGATRIRRLML